MEVLSSQVTLITIIRIIRRSFTEGQGVLD